MIYLIGAGGHARVIAEILELTGRPAGGAFDNDLSKTLWDYPVYLFPGPFNAASDQLILAIGDNKIRQRLASLYAALEFAIAIHPGSIISSRVSIGKGTVIMGAALINSGTSIGNHCIINSHASVDHDCKVGDYVHISPNVTLCGSIEIGSGTHIGAGAVIIPGKKIGANSVIGAGSVVITDIPDNCTAVGNPARIIKEKSN